jgi:rod shape-determining protein MreD
MNILLLSGILLLLAALQVRLPAIPALGVHLEFLPALVAYGALTLSRPGMLTLALIAGFTNDALSAGPFGLTGIAFAISGMIIYALREALDRELPALQIAAGVLVTVITAVAACCVAGFSGGRILRIALLATFATVVTPVLFFALDYLRYRVKTT